MFVALLLGAVAFVLYDCYNRKQQAQIKLEKDQAQAVVTSLFPQDVGQKLMEEQGSRPNNGSNRTLNSSVRTEQNKEDTRDLPLAELYPSASIMFADLKGTCSDAMNQACRH